ncbi:GIY-YIG nuclease family protein [Burkholderia sp. AU30280]|uniref:GIY-YIG nuclease family protein n=1 Tax=Burkholderia sp. AU30280 TaxID=2879628 RepID=UPI001CF377B1|nr:GIY-YIG nuclease family protein [Burkholderia sp. AU30280]MCA8275038.1 GIY-YIG nuclease family protein [Burkholderia sp. AU30280]
MATRKKSQVLDDVSDDDLLEQLGISVDVEVTGGRTAQEERIIAGFEEIQRFVEQHGYAPRHGEGFDIFERLYAVRLDQLRRNTAALALLAPLDTQGLLTQSATEAPVDLDQLGDDDLLAELGVEAKGDDDITVLRHVRSAAEKAAAEQIADRTPCVDFDKFKHLFDEAKTGLKDGTWEALPFAHDAEIKLESIQQGDFYILNGQIAYIAGMGEEIKTSVTDRPDARLRVIYDNETESDLLQRSFQKALYRDDTPRRLRKKDVGSLFSDEWQDDDIQSGTIYVLRSLSNDPRIAPYRQVIHKIGVTGGKVETRIADAENDATYLLAKVEVVTTYKLAGVNRTKVENLIHKIFASAQLDLEILDRFGKPVRPCEWFLVPLPIIDEAVQSILNGTILNKVYDRETGKLVSR